MKQEFYKTKEKIESWLKQYEITNYTLIPDEKYGYVVDVDGDVYLGSKNLDSIFVKFNYVKGHFECENNALTSLMNSPEKVGGGFYCYENQLTSLEFCPKEIGGMFSFSNNNIENLLYFPQSASSCSANRNEKLNHLQSKRNFIFLYKEHLLQITEKLKENIDLQIKNDRINKSVRKNKI